LLTFEQIQELIDQVHARELQGLEVEQSGFRLRIDGKTAPQPVAVSAPVVQGVAPAAAAPVAIAAAPAAAEEAAGGDDLPAGAEVIHSPIVGTFYGSPSPEAAAYVSVGARVEKGQVLCIVEAMKLMNEIEADVAGEIVKIYPSNEQPVEFGEPLFAIRPA